VFSFREKVEGLLVGERTGKRPFVIINSIKLSIVSIRRPLYSATGAVAVVKGEAGEWAGLMSPVRRKRVWASSAFI